MRLALWFRYRVTIKGLDQLNPSILDKPGGVLFLPNHPTVFVDPTLVALAIWKKYPIRPVIVEYMYYTPLVHSLMKFMDALPIPNFVNSSNSFKKKRVDEVMDEMENGLRNRENFLIYPAGKTKHQAKEVINASGVHKIIQSVPEANIVLVRTTGLWGSRFSRALTGGRPAAPMFQTIFWGIKTALKNLLFFTPRRHVTIEFTPAPADFPYQGSRIEMNRYLENWYNRPDGILPQEEEEPGESLYLVSYSMWKQDLPKIDVYEKSTDSTEISKIPKGVQQKVKEKLCKMSDLSIEQIQPDMDLSSDFGFDSLDNAELLAFLDDEFDVAGVPAHELTTVGALMGLAANQIDYGTESEEDEQKDLAKWNRRRRHKQAVLASGETMPEAFLNNSQLKKREVACADNVAGILSYSSARIRVIMLAEYIRHLPGEYIGILLPSSVAAYLTIFACQLAGKVPLLVNWTVGPRHLEAVVSLSNVQVILSSWSFLDRLGNVDLTVIEDQIVMLEDVRRKFTLKDKMKAYIRSFRSTQSLLSLFGINKLKPDDKAVLLFTSGTENLPKGVPLTHKNILSNQRACLKEVGLFQDDILLGFLPPFHSFGFTLTGLLPLLCGIRVVYYPDPTDGKGLAHAIEHWKATITCGAPSFLKAILKNTSVKQLQTLRFCVTGAEKAPKELFEKVNELINCQLIEGYGITECSPVLTINMSGKRENGVGKPLPGVDICIIDINTHEKVPQGQQGLIVVKGANIFKGYLNKGVSSPFMTIDGQNWYSTGDLGYLNEDGCLILSGRLKRFIKIGGEMVSLSAIEDALQKTIGNQVNSQEGPTLAICAKEQEGEKPKIVVFTKFASSTDDANRSLREAGFSNLVKIFKVDQIDEIPLMGSGKINYRSLESKLNSLIEQS